MSARRVTLRRLANEVLQLRLYLQDLGRTCLAVVPTSTRHEIVRSVQESWSTMSFDLPSPCHVTASTSSGSASSCCMSPALLARQCPLTCSKGNVSPLGLVTLPQVASCFLCSSPFQVSAVSWSCPCPAQNIVTMFDASQGVSRSGLPWIVSRWSGKLAPTDPERCSIF